MEMPPLYHWAELTDLPPDPIDLCSRLQRMRMPTLLHSGMQIGTYGDWSIATCEPDAVLRARGREVTVDLIAPSGEAETAPIGRVQQAVVSGDPFATIESVLAAHPAPAGECGLPFCGGLIGYLSYDWKAAGAVGPVRGRHRGPGLLPGLYTSALLVATAEASPCVPVPGGLVRRRERAVDRRYRPAAPARRRACRVRPATGC